MQTAQTNYILKITRQQFHEMSFFIIGAYKRYNYQK